MGSTDKFCLRWNDFESNISSAFRELRDDSDFFDVTLASADDRQVRAHKVILSACSPFFRRVLRRNPHEAPLLYLKGVKHSDLVAVLDFMYHGEVNVAQDELNSFLAVAEELSVKGLTTNGEQSAKAAKQTGKSSSSNVSSLAKQGRSSRPAIAAPTPAKRSRPSRPPPPQVVGGGEGADGNVVPIKTEPRIDKVGKEEGEEERFEEGDFRESFDDGEPGFEEEEEEGSEDFGGDEEEEAVDPVAGGSSAADGNKVAVAKEEDSEEIAYKVMDGSSIKTPVWVLKGYSYIKDFERDEKLYLRCRLYKRLRCKARAIINHTAKTFVAKTDHICDRV